MRRRTVDGQRRNSFSCSDQAGRIAGEIYTSPIRFKRAKEFRCSHVYEQPKPVLEEAGGRTSSRRYLRLWSRERASAGQGLVDLRKVIPPRARLDGETVEEEARKGESRIPVDDPMR